MADFDTSSYPRPQPQNNNPLAQLTQIGQAADSLGNIAVGQGVQQAIDPNTGEIDRNKLAGLLKQSVAGSMKAIPTLDSLEKLRQAGFSADQQGLETFQKRMAITHHLFSGLASKDKPTMDDVYDIATRALDPALDAKKYGITLPVIMNSLKAFRDPATDKPLPPDQIKKKALEIQTQAAATSEILHQHSPGQQIIDDNGNIQIVPTGTRENPVTNVAYPKDLPPTTSVATPGGPRFLGPRPPPPPPVRTQTSPDRPASLDQRFGGIPDVIPRFRLEAPSVALAPGQATAGGPAPGERTGTPSAGPRAPVPPDRMAPTGPAAGLRPGYEEAAKAIATSGAGAAGNLTAANEGAMGRKALLGNLDDLIGKFEPGKGADWTLVAKNFSNRNLPIPDSWKKEGGAFDLKSVASQEEFNKLAMQLAQSQFATIGGTGTDAKFSSAFETSPNELLSEMGNRSIIKLLKGNEDAIQSKNKAWQGWKRQHGPDTYDEFSAHFNEHFDPRAFQFKYLSKDERNDYVRKMDPAERERFIADLTYAHKQGWVNFTTGATK